MFWGSWRFLGGILEQEALGERAFGGFLELSWSILGAILEYLGDLLSSRRIFERFGRRFGPSWGHLRLSWGRIGPSWGHPGAVLGHLGHLEAILGPSWAILVPS